MRYYLKTTDQKLVESYRELAEMFHARVNHAREFAQENGFDEVGMIDFKSRITFFKKVTADDKHLNVGPAIDGFRACRENPIERYKGDRYFRYYFHGRSKVATALKKQLSEGMPPTPKELNGKQFRSTVDTAFCIRHGLPTDHFAGNKILYSTVFLLHGNTLVMSLPVTGDEVVIPESCEEITERAAGAEVDKHNAALKEPSHDNQ